MEFCLARGDHGRFTKSWLCRKPPQGKIAPSAAERASDCERWVEKEEGNAPPVGARSLARHPFGFPFALIGAVPSFSKELCELAGVLAEGRRVGVHLADTAK